jgi:hypothetical protein
LLLLLAPSLLEPLLLLPLLPLGCLLLLLRRLQHRYCSRCAAAAQVCPSAVTALAFERESLQEVLC